MPALLLGAMQNQPPAHVRAELVGESDSIAPGKTMTLAVKLTMEKGWHTYWRNPGDAGMATSVTWVLPPGFKASGIRWPYPSRIETSRVVSYGYLGEAYLLSDIRAPKALRAGAQVNISAKVKWLECRESCLSGAAELSLPMRVGEAKNDSKTAALFLAARSRIPGRLGVDPFGDFRARALRDKDKIRLILQPAARSAEFFPYRDGVIANDEPQRASVEGRSVILELTQARAPQAGHAPKLYGVLVLKDQAQAIELSVPIENQAAKRKPS